ncbi:hypothetical protein HHL11_18775 [Ramlibacter sp. G-1-2-2]|uniref:Uncharacterized protein n=1 Tax=Ramlibacter agri TaxID=2728837 RepID=A0A848H8G6_9BURK|nr:hypothetical protein [Ramlibacter agri]NML45799.1 hypothetical protein [Ramlibacter agri]
MSQTALTISQKDHFQGNFGEVYRSSALFWARTDASVRTTISLTNYWKYKNNTEVAVLLNARTLDGRLAGRTRVDFGASEVFEYSPPAGFEGSIEVEAFAAKNMRIPYAAVMAVYECADSVSMVHSYSRAYSQHEVEDGRTITVGEESCWTLRDDAQQESFGVFHNGPVPAPAQVARLSVRNATGEERTAAIRLPELRPFETVVVVPGEHVPALSAFLAGQAGNARLSFRVEASFTRMLCAVRRRDGTQLQVTHSNFDYSRHRTDHVEVRALKAFMALPRYGDSAIRREVVVYPDADPGEYSVGSDEQPFVPGRILARGCGPAADELVFARRDGALPTRIVTGMRLYPGAAGVIPAECSLGVVHGERPRKHFAWMLVSARLACELSWVDYRQVYGGCPDDAEVVFHLYTARRKEPWKKSLRYGELPAAGHATLGGLFGEAVACGDEFGYLTAWCSYGGLQWFSALRKKGAITIEHAF